MNKVLVVYKRSLYDWYSASQNQDVQQYLVQNPDDVARLRQSHEEQQRTLESVISELQRRNVSHDLIHRAKMSEVQNHDLVISVGGDGTFLEVSHYIHHIPILGVNSDQNRSTGYFCSSDGETFKDIFNRIEIHPRTIIRRLQIQRDNTLLQELILNDIFISHKNPAAMTHYELSVDGKQLLNHNGDYHKRSSGLVVCTAAGSTAWMHEMGGRAMPLFSTQMQYHERDVRNSPFSLAEEEIKVRSLTREGMMYLDGEHLKYEFGLGTELRISPGFPLTIIGDLEEKRKDIYIPIE